MSDPLTREQLRELLLKPLPPIMEAVPIQEMGGAVFYVRMMTGIERDEFETTMAADKDKRMVNFRAKLAVRCTCDSTGALICTGEDVAQAGKQLWPILDRLATVALRINRMSDGSLEELKGNSAPSPGDAQS